MCGIAGYVSDTPIAPEVIDAMTDVLAHRGPDGRGVFVDARHGIALGHRRLSILDAEGGAQPMVSACRQFVITFNGEIFNYAELRRELIGAGVTLRTQSDTEVLLESFVRRGPAILDRLNGMFAFAIADLRDGSLFLARDPMGEKPLYYVEANGGFAFGSEIKALLQFPGVRRNVDPEPLHHYLSLNYVPGERSMIEGIRRLGAGCQMIVRHGGAAIHRYWSLPVIETESPRRSQRSMSAAIEEFSHVFDDAVRLRLRSDVPVGLFLSSGVDTSLVASTVAGQGRNDVTAFSASFADPRFDESEAASRTAGKLGLRFEREPVEFDPSTTLSSVVAHADDPLGDSSAVPTGLICGAAASRVKVVLGGDGADELFGGYLTHRASQLASKYRLLPSSIRAALARGAEFIPRGHGKVSPGYKLQRFLRGAMLPGGESHLAWNGSWRDEEKLTLYSEDWQNKVARLNTFGTFAGALGIGVRSRLRDFLRADQLLYLPDDILVKTDRMSMAHGLEVRSPFLDKRIVEFAAKLPATLKATIFRGKILLREVLRRRGLGEVARRSKQGFSAPVHAWLRGPLREQMENLLSTSSLSRLGIFDPAAVKKQMDAHSNGRRDLGFELWGLMVFVTWHERFIQSGREECRAIDRSAASVARRSVRRANLKAAVSV